MARDCLSLGNWCLPLLTAAVSQPSQSSPDYTASAKIDAGSLMVCENFRACDPDLPSVDVD